jgi:mandelamide amidase
VFDGMVLPGAQKAIPLQAYNAALAARPKLQKLFADAFAKNKIAAIAFAMTPLPAAPIGDDETTKLNGQDVPIFPTFIRNADPGSNAGIPGIAIPIARTQAGLPIGLGLDGPAGSDRKLLSIGLALEKLFGRLQAP